MKKLLIQACSGGKFQTRRKTPALDLYDGTAFRVIKKFLREFPHRRSEMEILILSAEYGLISAAEEISIYDRKMDKNRAESLQTQNYNTWQKLTAENRFDDIFINVGRIYLTALNLIEFPPTTIFALGGIGSRNRQLKIWLNS